nr:metalloregulator ArsR/SmtB family transcription factor [uncultured Arsenicibacter sp.]
MQKYQQLADVLKGTGHPTRIAIIKAIGEKEKSVNELSEASGAEQSLTSHHLEKLKHCGVVESRREGKFVLYRLNFASQVVRSIYEEVICLN